MKRLNPVALKRTPKIPIETYIKESLAKATEDLVLRVKTIDGLLGTIDFLLEHRQPFMSGRVRLVFDMDNGVLRPQVVVWQWMRLGKEWRYDRKPPTNLSKRAKKARQFHDNHELVRDLLKDAQNLMTIRRGIVTAVSIFGMGAGKRLEHAGKKAAFFNEKLTKLSLDKHNPAYKWFDEDVDPVGDDDNE